MNIVLLRISLIITGLVTLVFLFTHFAPLTWIKHVYKVVDWLIEITFLFFVDIVIFLKPLKNHRKEIGFLIWLLFVGIVGRYLIIKQPLITEIQSPFIPFIGYIYFISTLYIIKIIFNLMVKNGETID
ncbi:MAG TPA: hypothetical protein G4N92_02180 [Anaerolineae bacterium]|nr:hypothetical protein [Anaerolineae bacterium]